MQNNISPLIRQFNAGLTKFNGVRANSANFGLQTGNVKFSTQMQSE
jgi:hypothetical protein